MITLTAFDVLQDTVPAWIGGVGGLLGAAASIYAVFTALRAGREHVSWSKLVTAKNRFEIVNLSKSTIASVTKVEEVSTPSGALMFSIDVPFDVLPGTSFPCGVDRGLAQPNPTLVRITWSERRIGDSPKRVRKSTSQMLFL